MGRTGIYTGPISPAAAPVDTAGMSAGLRADTPLKTIRAEEAAGRRNALPAEDTKWAVRTVTTSDRSQNTAGTAGSRTEQPPAKQAGAERAGGERQRTERPEATVNRTERSGMERQRTETVNRQERPATERPGTTANRTERPATERPGTTANRSEGLTASTHPATNSDRTEIPVADTLAQADRSYDWPFPVYGTADTLRLQLAGHAATAPKSAPASASTVSAEAVFGPHATLEAAQPLHPRQQPSLTDNAVFQGFVLLLAAAYALLLYFNLGDVRSLVSRISRDTTSGKRLFDDPGSNGFMRFLNTTSAIGMLFLGILAVKYGDSLMPAALLELLPHGAVLALSLLATAGCLAVILYQWAAVRIAGAVTLAQPFTAQLQLLRRTYFSLAVIVISPALLLFALCPRGTGNTWFLLIVIELAVTVVLYLREALNLFISKKISILHWFLYLCIVEVFPISFLWLVATR